MSIGDLRRQHASIASSSQAGRPNLRRRPSPHPSPKSSPNPPTRRTASTSPRRTLTRSTMRRSASGTGSTRARTRLEDRSSCWTEGRRAARTGMCTLRPAVLCLRFSRRCSLQYPISPAGHPRDPLECDGRPVYRSGAPILRRFGASAVLFHRRPALLEQRGGTGRFCERELPPDVEPNAIALRDRALLTHSSSATLSPPPRS